MNAGSKLPREMQFNCVNGRALQSRMQSTSLFEEFVPEYANVRSLPISVAVEFECNLTPSLSFLCRVIVEEAKRKTDWRISHV